MVYRVRGVFVTQVSKRRCIVQLQEQHWPPTKCVVCLLCKMKKPTPSNFPYTKSIYNENLQIKSAPKKWKKQRSPRR